jgi:NADH-quinone oxidoreductase subunit N
MMERAPARVPGTENADVNAETVSALLNFYPWLLPEGILALFACVLFLGGTFKASRNVWGVVALVGLGAALVCLLLVGRPAFASREEAFATLYASPILLDRLAILVKVITLVGGGTLVLFSWDEVAEDRIAEYHACLLSIIAGVCITASANDLITLFLALELVSIPTYVLLYLVRVDDPGKEAAVKYFLLSIFSSALFLFGLSYLYGLSGTTNLQGVADAFSHRAEDPSESIPGMALVALVMVVAGIGFRITAVPFHFYAPDVYQGTSTGAAALLAFIPKVAGFVALIRLLGFVPYELVVGAETLRGGWAKPDFLGTQLSTLLWIIAAVTMTLGNVLALLQDNIKRLLAYSSVAHAGYMLIGLAVAPYLLGESGPTRTLSTIGLDAVIFYLASYGAMTIGAFAVVEYLNTRERPVETVDDLGGLGKTNPGVALLMAVFLFSLIGIPATAGFVGKLMLFLGAFSVPPSAGPGALGDQANLFRILALIAVLNAAVGAWYYLRMVAAMYLRPSAQPFAKPGVSPRLVAIWICAFFTLFLGIYSRPLVDESLKAFPNRIEIATPAVTADASPRR